ncbi:uncharacterized protein LOC142233925 [Haematobia irritans]|uniref:uncharacterized protein LOC142233925 n=1 Tax=Haematobia irritans TaxID=7368 RepID=UPI003F4F6892
MSALFCIFAILLISGDHFTLSYETLGNAVKKWQDHKTDVAVLETLVGDMHKVLNVALKQSKTENEILFKSTLERDNMQDDSKYCTQIPETYKISQTNHKLVEDNIVNKMNKINDEVILNLKKILDLADCNGAASLTASPQGNGNEIARKIENFEKQLQDYEHRERELQAQNEKHLKHLRDISNRLSDQQKKFDQMEEQMQKMITAAKAKGASSNADNKVAMDLVVGMLNKKDQKIKV